MCGAQYRGGGERPFDASLIQKQQWQGFHFIHDRITDLSPLSLSGLWQARTEDSELP